MTNNKVEIAGLNTKDLKVLSEKEMYELFVKKNNGDKEAREQLAIGNLRLVLSILKRFSNRDVNMDDLFQTGCQGLMKAIDNFDLSYNLKFSTYAVPVIDGEIKRYIRDNSSCLRISRSLKDIAYKCVKFQDEYVKEFGKSPTYEEMAHAVGTNIYDVISALGTLKPLVSMYDVIYNDGGDAIYVYDQIEDKKNNSKDFELQLSVNDAINKLSEREQFILDERFVMGKTQMEVAEELMISQAQVSRLEHGAIKQLNKVLR